MRRASLPLSCVGLALLHNLASGFSRQSPMPPLPTSAFLRHALPRQFAPSRARTTAVVAVRGGDVARGAAAAAPGDVGAPDLDRTAGAALASLWGAGGVVYILWKAIARVLPIALEPFAKGEGVVPLTQFQLAAYVLTCLFFAYFEGYKGFQRKFSPLVVSRAFTLGAASPLHHLLLAPLYSMALFHAKRRRLIVSWSVSLGVAAVVASVKRLPYPWRNIVDAGVVIGLTWGSISIVGGYVISLTTGIAPIDVDPALPEKRE